jgi:MFS superfamily sulfate permease-like transporter
MDTFIITIIGTIVSILVAVVIIICLSMLAILQKVHEEAVHTNGRLKDLEGKGFFRAGEEAERKKQAIERGKA